MKKHPRKNSGRYDVSELVEAQFEPGTRWRVLKNLLGIKRKREMDRTEAREQLRALHELIRIYGKNHRFTAADICRIHKVWLGMEEWGQISILEFAIVVSSINELAVPNTPACR
jgi:hypothetical protein